MSHSTRRDFEAARRSLARADTLRDELEEKIEATSARDGEGQRWGHREIRSEQTQIAVISAIVTLLAAIVGLIFANLVSGGIIRSVRQLLEGTRAVEAGQLDQSIDVKTSDEIGQLAAAFNRMVVQLRDNQRIKETFGKYIDPRVVEGLIDRPNLTAAEGQRRVMTVVFCDLKGFTSLSEGMTPQGLVKVMNRYLSIMSEPIRTNRGIIDKYLGDGIMAYWGPPFVDEADHAQSGMPCRDGNGRAHPDIAHGKFPSCLAFGTRPWRHAICGSALRQARRWSAASALMS